MVRDLRELLLRREIFGAQRGPIGLPFVGFVVAILGLALVAITVQPGSIDRWIGSATQLGVLAATLYLASGVLAALRAVRRRARSTGLIALVLLGPGAVWCWVVFVRGADVSGGVHVAVSMTAAVLAVTLLTQGLRLAHWLEVFAGLGSLALLLVGAMAGNDADGAATSAAVALLAVAGGMTCLYGALVEFEMSEQRALVDLLDSRRHIEEEVDRAEEVLHDLRSGLLAIESAIASFDGELAGTIQAEAARLRRLTVRDRRNVTVFDLVARVRNLIATRQAGGAVVDLSAPDSAQVWGEETEVLSIIENLLSNAERHGTAAPIEVRIGSRSGVTRLEVSNRGRLFGGGDDPEVIFARGTTTHADGKGIGLSRARTLAAMNRGELVVEPSGEGIVTFALDLLSEPPVSAA